MAVSEKYPVRILFERRAVDHPWQDHVWAVVGVVPAGEGAGASSGLVHREGERARYLSDAFDVELFRKETAGYKENLSQPVPLVYAVLRPTDEDSGEDDAPEVALFHVTVCPYEAEGYTESGEEIVGGAAMPDSMRTLVQTFIDTHHVDEPFKKRKRDKKSKDEGGRRPPMDRR